jgi:hypothetical protein
VQVTFYPRKLVVKYALSVLSSKLVAVLENLM